MQVFFSVWVLSYFRYLLFVQKPFFCTRNFPTNTDFIIDQILKSNKQQQEKTTEETEDKDTLEELFDAEKIRDPWDYERLFKYYVISTRVVQRNNGSKGKFVFAAVTFLVISVALTFAEVITIFLSEPQQQGNGELTCKQLSTIETRIINGTNIFAPSSSNKESKVLLCLSK